MSKPESNPLGKNPTKRAELCNSIYIQKITSVSPGRIYGLGRINRYKCPEAQSVHQGAILDVILMIPIIQEASLLEK